MNIHITDAAIRHFTSLIEKEGGELGLRIFVEKPGSPVSEVVITFCAHDDVSTDLSIAYHAFILYVDSQSIPYLEAANIDYEEDNLGGQLAISAPNLHPKPAAFSAAASGSSPGLSAQIQQVLENEINPNLAGHGGRVSLVEMTEHHDVVLRFGGGCHGCGMVDVTLKQGIEKSLKAHFPMIRAVIDVTDHSQGTAPYY